MERVTCKVTLPYVKYGQATGICCMSQKTKTGTLYQPRGMGREGRWGGSSRGRGYIYLWLIQAEVRKQQNSVKQLSFS